MTPFTNYVLNIELQKGENSHRQAGRESDFDLSAPATAAVEGKKFGEVAEWLNAVVLKTINGL